MNNSEAVAWFSPNVVYRGEGRAVFEDPAAVAVGPAEARFDEYGREHITMEIRRWETDEDLGEHLPMAVLGGVRPQKHNGVTRLAIDAASRNRCLSLSIETEGGRFFAQNLLYFVNAGALIGLLSEIAVAFSLGKWGTFEPASAHSPATYWTLPLTNFITEYSGHTPALHEHPLRLQPFKDPGPGASDDERTIASYSVQSVIPFTFGEELAFIEPLPDHEARAKKLKEGTLRETVMAVMVGRVPEGQDATDLNAWLPFDLLHVLSFATGTTVSGLWIELREANGNLVQRVHGRLGRPCFAPGHRVIRESRRRGIGDLLTAATASEHWRKTELRVALRQSVLAGRNYQLLEERLGECAKGLDGLGDYFKVVVQSLSEQLPSSYRQPIRTMLQESAGKVRALKEQARRHGNHAAAGVLDTVESRVANAANKNRSFGDVVTELLRRFGYPDADILEAHYAQLGTGLTWSRTLSGYRNPALHGSYFAARRRPIDREEILAIAFHLHDILIRLLLRMVGYAGEYQPPVVRTVSLRPLDWVTPKTTAAQLGYLTAMRAKSGVR